MRVVRATQRRNPALSNRTKTEYTKPIKHTLGLISLEQNRFLVKKQIPVIKPVAQSVKPVKKPVQTNVPNIPPNIPPNCSLL